MTTVSNIKFGYQDITLTLQSLLNNDDSRSALREAALMSPFVRPGTDVIVRQDPSQPNTWTLSVSLLPVRGAAASFRGQLLELTREIVHARSDAGAAPETETDDRAGDTAK